MDTSPQEVNPSASTVEALSAPFRDLFDAEFGYVCRSLLRLGVRAGDMEDVAQELFVTVHRSWDSYDPRRASRPWLFSFALRFAANYRRLARNRGHVSGDTLGELPDTSRTSAEARDIVLRALETLDFARRVIVVMHDLEGFDAPEIASQLGIPLNTVYSRLRLGRADFRSAVERLQPNGGAS